MKNVEFLSSMKNNRVLLIAAGGVVGSLVVAALVYFGLRTILPRNAQTNSPTNSQETPQGKDQIAKQADTLYQAGDAALKIGDAEKGIAELKKALALYEQTGDVMKVEEIKDQISLAEYAIKVESDYKSAETPVPGAGGNGKAVKTP
jgi:hypothetical protein